VGVARQYCGQLGKQDNRRVAVSLSVANDGASLPIAFRLYLPEDWAADKVRRRKAGVPEAVVFRTKSAIALEQIEAAVRAEVARGVVLADAAYGNDTGFRDRLTAWRLPYVVGLQSSTTVWPPGTSRSRPRCWRARCRRRAFVRWLGGRAARARSGPGSRRCGFARPIAIRGARGHGWRNGC